MPGHLHSAHCPHVHASFQPPRLSRRTSKVPARPCTHVKRPPPPPHPPPPIPPRHPNSSSHPPPTRPTRPTPHPTPTLAPPRPLTHPATSCMASAHSAAVWCARAASCGPGAYGGAASSSARAADQALSANSWQAGGRGWQQGQRCNNRALRAGRREPTSTLTSTRGSHLQTVRVYWYACVSGTWKATPAHLCSTAARTPGSAALPGPPPKDRSPHRHRSCPRPPLAPAPVRRTLGHLPPLSASAPPASPLLRLPRHALPAPVVPTAAAAVPLQAGHPSPRRPGVCDLVPLLLHLGGPLLPASPVAVFAVAPAAPGAPGHPLPPGPGLHWGAAGQCGEGGHGWGAMDLLSSSYCRRSSNSCISISTRGGNARLLTGCGRLTSVG